MKLPSIQHIANSTYATVKRFPFETLSAIVGTTAAFCLLVNNEQESLFAKIILCSALGLVVFLSTSLLFESEGSKQQTRLGTQFLLLGLLSGYYFTFSKEPTEDELIRFFVLNTSFHLGVSFAAFLGNKFSLNSFWEFNKQLFIRIITGGIYSGVLFAGLALAITAVSKLFDIDFDSKIYARLFFFIAGIFNTLFFLAGIPSKESFESDVQYPKGLKSFTQYVLIPLVSIYLLILLAYEFKIVGTISLPYGWVSNLILVFAIFGILSFLLLYPISSHTDHPWIKTFNRWFYYFLLPLLVLLFWAIGYRINMYGFTEERYYVFILALWLSFITGYFLWVKNQNIKIIPISLCLTGLISIYGPQSARSVAQYSQLKRYDFYFGLYQTKTLTPDDEREMCRVVDYVMTNGGLSVIAERSNNRLDSLQQNKPDATAYDIMTTLNIKYISRYGSFDNENNHFDINQDKNQYTISGYDILVTVPEYGQSNTKDSLLIHQTNYLVKATKEKNQIMLSINNEKTPIDVATFVNTLKPERDKKYTDADLTQMIETTHYSIKIKYTNLRGSISNNTYKLNTFSADVYIKIK